MDLAPFRPFIAELAARSGDFIRPHFGDAALAVETKSDLTPVTAADRGAEQFLRDLIRQNYPAHGVIGEEFGPENADAEFVWVLDPIDGTKSFISGTPLWGTLIALLHRGQPVLGAIHLVALHQLLIGDGATTTLNDRPVRTRATARLADATVLTSDTRNLARFQPAAPGDRLVAEAKLFRTWGDCYGYALVAAGWADAMLDPIMNPWDIAALVPVIRGAGGVITDWSGGPPYPAQSTIAAATPELHAAVLRAL